MVRRLTPTSSHAFMIEIVFRSTWLLASEDCIGRALDSLQVLPSKFASGPLLGAAD